LIRPGDEAEVAIEGVGRIGERIERRMTPTAILIREGKP
jgi:hypothetical protein